MNWKYRKQSLRASDLEKKLNQMQIFSILTKSKGNPSPTRSVSENVLKKIYGKSPDH